jgi:hypothetical protein
MLLFKCNQNFQLNDRARYSIAPSNNRRIQSIVSKWPDYWPVGDCEMAIIKPSLVLQSASAAKLDCKLQGCHIPKDTRSISYQRIMRFLLPYGAGTPYPIRFSVLRDYNFNRYMNVRRLYHPFAGAKQLACSLFRACEGRLIRT